MLFIHTYSGGVLLLLVQAGAASLLAVAVLLQRVEHLIGQLQVHPQPITDMDLWSKLEEERNRYVLEAQATKRQTLCQYQRPSYVVHARRVLTAAGLRVMFGGDVLAFPCEASPGCRLGLV